MGEAVPDVVAPGVVALGDVAAGLGVADRGPADPVVVLDVAVGVEGAFVVGFAAAVVRVGAEVAVAAGGATRGAWPEPNAKPMTLPAGGS